MKKLAFGFIFAAVIGFVLHAGHPDAAHLSASHHECGLCQVVTDSHAPVIATVAPHFQSSETVSTHFIVLANNNLFFLPDLRGPPAV